MKNKKIKFNNDIGINGLQAGDQIILSGIIYTARDMAHKRLIDLINKGKNLPVDIEGQFIYYMGPSPAKPGCIIGSSGPTTSKRMNEYAPILLNNGLKGIIGKGPMSKDVIRAIKKNKGIYFTAIGGAGAYYSEKIISSKIIAFKDLGPEAVYELEIDDFPVVVAIDSEGNNIYEKSSNFIKRGS